MARSIHSASVLVPGFLLCMALGANTAAAQRRFGSYCSATLYHSNWGVLVDEWASPSTLCVRVRNQFLNGFPPDEVRSGYYPIDEFNQVVVTCSAPYNLRYVASGYGSEPYYEAFDVASGGGYSGCLFTLAN